MMVETETASEKLDFCFKFTQLITREDFIFFLRLLTTVGLKPRALED
jgi:hypothetical protein